MALAYHHRCFMQLPNDTQATQSGTTEAAGRPPVSLSLLTSGFVEVFRQERLFLAILGVAIFLAGALYENAFWARWLGFVLAGYSAIANDSIQTIGTFISSNSDKKWWHLWLYIGGIFLATVGTSWVIYDGDVSWQRLMSKGFTEAPTEFQFLQVAAPIFLLILTRLRMPVSTTFLLLSCFSTSASGIQGVLMKSLNGYVVAFVSALVVWVGLSWVIKRVAQSKPPAYWMFLQWVTSGALWSVWIMQDAANIAVYLPRQLSAVEFGVFSISIFLGLGIIFYLRGDTIQKVVNEKSSVADIRAATIIDMVYALVMIYFTGVNSVPMSTTWVFIGLLAGREFAISITKSYVDAKPLSKAFVLGFRDIVYAGIGLLVSISLAITINPLLKDELFKIFE